ncbi:hypothetical protein LC724_20220 [Blautia sp. RD014234]|nr:hypothetical protein [Blautia parvula]
MASCFYAGIQIELEAEADLLLFENEHQLGTKPKEIDVLIVKKKEMFLSGKISEGFSGRTILWNIKVLKII